jgi:hypothetical protein
MRGIPSCGRVKDDETRFHLVQPMKPLILYKFMLPYATICIMSLGDGMVEHILGLISDGNDMSRSTVRAETRLNIMRNWIKGYNHTRLGRNFVF